MYKTKTRHPLNNTYSMMKGRCYNPNNKSYIAYGARGIKVCARWKHSFKDFLDDMGPRPEGYTLERIDVNGDYSPSNCKWIPKAEQNYNMRTNNLVPNVYYWKTRGKWKVSKNNKHYGVFNTYEEAVEKRIQVFGCI